MFESVDQIRHEFGLNKGSPEDLRRELRKLLAEVHPDRHNGAFATDGDKELYLKINAAISFLDKTQEAQTALVPIAVVADLVKAMRESMPVSKEVSLETRLSEQITAKVSQIGSKNTLPKITASAITLAMTALWLFPSTIESHPILSRYINPQTDGFSIVWLYSIIVTFIIWFCLSINEDRERRFKLRLAIESFQNDLFMRFLHQVRHQSFTKENFINFLMYSVSKTSMRSSSRFYQRLFGNPENIDPDLAQSIADVVFERAIKRKIIKEDGKLSLSPQYIDLRNQPDPWADPFLESLLR